MSPLTYCYHIPLAPANAGTSPNIIFGLPQSKLESHGWILPSHHPSHPPLWLGNMDTYATATPPSHKLPPPLHLPHSSQPHLDTFKRQVVHPAWQMFLNRLGQKPILIYIQTIATISMTTQRTSQSSKKTQQQPQYQPSSDIYTGGRYKTAQKKPQPLTQLTTSPLQPHSITQPLISTFQ